MEIGLFLTKEPISGVTNGLIFGYLLDLYDAFAFFQLGPLQQDIITKVPSNSAVYL